MRVGNKIEIGKQYRVHYPTPFGVSDLHANHEKLVTVKGYDKVAQQWHVIDEKGRSVYYYQDELNDPSRKVE